MAQDVSIHRLWMLYDGIHLAYDGYIWLKMWPTSASDAVRWHAFGVCMLYDGFPVEYLCRVCVVWGEGLWGKLSSYLAMASSNCSVVSSGRVHRI